MVAPFRGPRTDTHARWFRRLLKLLPSDFRDAYGRDMERTFRAQQRDAARGGIFGVAALGSKRSGICCTPPHASTPTSFARTPASHCA